MARNKYVTTGVDEKNVNAKENQVLNDIFFFFFRRRVYEKSGAGFGLEEVSVNLSFIYSELSVMRERNLASKPSRRCQTSDARRVQIYCTKAPKAFLQIMT